MRILALILWLCAVGYYSWHREDMTEKDGKRAFALATAGAICAII